MPIISVSEQYVGERLDRFLAQKMEASRSQIQKLIKNGTITINNEVGRPKTLIEIGDKIFFPEAETLTPLPKTGPAPLLDILYQDDDLIVINKPAGLIVHQATERDTNPNVVDALLEISPETAQVGDDPTRPGIVHRLDKDVSGVMVLAKTQEAFESLKEQFKNRTVNKEYLALVYGELPQDSDTIVLRIARSKARGRMVARQEDQEGKAAVSEYSVINRYKFTTYVRVNILTGRTHQIRVHFQAIGHPLVGDKLYKQKHMKINPIKLDRIFLHAHTLTIKLMDGKERSFEVPLPEELEALLRAQIK